MLRTSPVKDDAPVKALNGHTYIVNNQAKTAKKVAEKKKKEFIMNLDADALERSWAAENTKILGKFLTDHFADKVQLKNGWVNVFDYRIKYASHGFIIRDMRNFGEIVNVNDYHNDFPRPEVVLEFLQQNVERPIAKITKNALDNDEVRRGQLMKLATFGKLKIVKVEGGKEVISEIIPEPKKDRLMVELIAAVRKYISGDSKYTATRDRLRKRAPEKIRKELVDLFNQLHKKELNHRQVLTRMNKLIADYLEQKKAAKPERAPRFEAPELWEPINLKITCADVWYDSVTNETSVKTDWGVDIPELMECLDSDIMWLRFLTKGISGKRYEVTCTLEEYLSNVVLNAFPRAMAMLVKLAKGELKTVDLSKMGKLFVSDPFCHYDITALRHPVDRNEFCRVCYEIIYGNELDVATNWVYTDEFKIGDSVRVVWPDYATISKGKVINTEAGLEVRFEDGSTSKIMKHHIVKFN